MPQVRIKSLGKEKEELIVSLEQEVFDKVMNMNLIDLLGVLEQFIAAESGYRIDSDSGLQRLSVYSNGPRDYSILGSLGTINTRDFLWLWFSPFDQVASLVTSKVPEWKAIAITRAKCVS